MLTHQLLGGIRMVEMLTARVGAGTGVVPTHDEVAAAVVLFDDGVPKGFAWACQTHGQGQQRE